MKTLQEAMGLRNALLSNFERSVTCATEQERRELLNIVIVGGGATGVEIAGALAEMKRYVLPKDYPDMNENLLQIYLIEAGNRLLSCSQAWHLYHLRNQPNSCAKWASMYGWTRKYWITATIK